MVLAKERHQHVTRITDITEALRIRLKRRSFQDMHATRIAEANDVRQADFCAFNLAVTGLAAKVMADLPDVRNACRSDGVSL